MKFVKKIIHGWIILLVLLTCFFLLREIPGTDAEVLYVDDDGNTNHTSLRSAIENASDGDTIRVYAGTYYENMIVDRSVILQGNGSGTTIIDGHGGEYVLNITADGVNISGFELKNATVGVILHTADDCVLDNNTFIHNDIGLIARQRAENNTAHHNMIYGNSQYGIQVVDNDGFIINAIMNWWGSNSGPYHADNPDGKGNNVTDHVIYDPWKTRTLDHEVSFNRGQGIFMVYPNIDGPGQMQFNLTIMNKGNLTDTYYFELLPDTETDRYGHWITLPAGVTIGAGEQRDIVFDLEVFPYHVDKVAFADGILKNITFRVYSKEARDHDLEVIGETTDDFLCQVFIEEYKHAIFSTINPTDLIMDPRNERIVTVTIINLGNGIESYSLVKDGEDGLGSNIAWYDFNVTFVNLMPLESRQVSITVRPDEDALSDIYSLHFHARSETGYETGQGFFRIAVTEIFGGVFLNAVDDMADPGQNISITISVWNSGNSPNTFFLKDPEVPEGWAAPSWSGSNPQLIDPHSLEYFTLIIPVPIDIYKARPGISEFAVEGEYENATGFESIPGIATFNLTVNPAYRVNVLSDYPFGSGKPGMNVTFHAKITNTGNVNETFQLSIHPASGFERANDWAEIVGADPDDQVTIPLGETRSVDIEVSIPDFSIIDDDAEEGLFGLTLKAVSLSNNDEESEMVFIVTVEGSFGVKIWADIPGKSETLKENDDTEMSFTISVRNLGNTNDDIVVSVPDDELSGDMSDWDAEFGSSNEKTVPLGSLAQIVLALDLTIDKNTDPGEYTFRVRAESSGDPSIYMYTTIYVNLSKASYGLELEKVFSYTPNVNPADEEEIEYKFTLENTGNQDDKYELEVEISLTSGTYKNWEMYFLDKDGVRRDSITIPEDLPDQSYEYLAKGDRIDITLNVICAIDEDAGYYDAITISGTSINDRAQVGYVSFDLTVINSNIEIRNDLADFYIEPNKNIKEGDDIDITVTIYNTGTAETDDFYVWFYNGKSESPSEGEGHYIAVEKVDNIPAGQDIDIMVTWADIPGGTNDVYVYADKPIKTGLKKTEIDGSYSQDGEVLESRENDNFASINDVFQEELDLRPDLMVTGVEFDDKTAGESGTTVTVTVANVGSAKVSAGTAIVSIKIKGDYLQDAKTSSQTPLISEEIDVDDDIDIEFTWDVPDDEGSNLSVMVSIDYEDENPQNNDLRTSVVVGERNSGIIEETRSNLLCMIFPIILIVTFLGSFILGRRYDIKQKKKSSKKMTGKGKKGSGKSKETGKGTVLSTESSTPPKSEMGPQVEGDEPLSEITESGDGDGTLSDPIISEDENGSTSDLISSKEGNGSAFDKSNSEDENGLTSDSSDSKEDGLSSNINQSEDYPRNQSSGANIGFSSPEMIFDDETQAESFLISDPVSAPYTDSSVEPEISAPPEANMKSPDAAAVPEKQEPDINLIMFFVNLETTDKKEDVSSDISEPDHKTLSLDT